MKPHNFDCYRDKYETITLQRTDDGILQVTVHDLGEPDKALQYGKARGWQHANLEWGYCFNDIARDYENEVVIITHAGDDFIKGDHTMYRENAERVGQVEPMHPEDFDQMMSNQKWLQMSVLNIECPVITAFRGEAVVHAELGLNSDVVLCDENAVFQDLPHFEDGCFVPGDGVHVMWPDLLGTLRGRYFLITGQKLDARKALELGVVNEVLPKEEVLPRAYELARMILKRPKLVRRYTRILGTQQAKERVMKYLGHGLALEGLGMAGRRVDGQ